MGRKGGGGGGGPRPEVCRVVRDAVEDVHGLHHASKLCVQHLVPVVCPVDLDGLVHALAKVLRFSFHHLQSHLVPQELVHIEKACHDLVDDVVWRPDRLHRAFNDKPCH